MSDIFIYAGALDEVEAERELDGRGLVHVRIGDGFHLYLPVQVAERLHTVLGEALAAKSDGAS